ncbi:MAG: DUF2817 domain-containing protein [Bdellovibrionales bacterium CG10_big_fil_rev_8_21_14_0_10_45_34]|nr:MAG: DUF2817 domain-containing protein [Bdellovibrionales bacterium CG10_big_fil_rev_8_21_14_0_10_45_34]
MRTFVLGKSAGNLPILAYEFGYSGPKVLILGGVHGDETEGVVCAQGLLNRFLLAFSLRLQCTIVPIFNPDGVFSHKRTNANDVDLNRNLPTNDWTADWVNPRYKPGQFAASEPESQTLVKYIGEFKPRWILSLHSWKPLLNVNGRCLRQAETISTYTGYPIEDSIGYPTPGCLGTYAGLERDFPTLTYEIERGLPTEKVLGIHVPAVWESLKSTESEEK